jgi:hypothetical protein
MSGQKDALEPSILRHFTARLELIELIRGWQFTISFFSIKILKTVIK